MRIIGVTGPIAAGKSTVDVMLRDLGADPVIDADHVVHDLYATSQPLKDALVNAFGPTVRGRDGLIDRKALGSLVFGDAAALRRLEELVHPATREAMVVLLAATPPGGVAVVDAVKLLQGGLAAFCSTRWWVATSVAEQRRRLMDVRGFSEPEAAARIAAQPALDQYKTQVEVVIDNSGTLDATRAQVEKAWRAFIDAKATS